MKFLHIFNVPKGQYFAKLLIDVINNNSEFDKKEHDFCLRDKAFFDSLNYSNIFFDGSDGSLAAKYIDKYDFVFLHGLTSTNEFNELPKDKLNKIIWRTWGGSSGLYSIRRKNIILFLRDVAKRHKRKNIVNKMKIVCGANAIDLVDTKQKSNHFFEFPYPIKDIISDTLQSNIDIGKDEVNILVGHSAYYTDKHEIVLTHLKKWIDFNIKIFVPLTYGKDEYKNKIIRKWQPIFGKKICFITEQMPFNDYKHLISDMNLVFLVGDRSYALGNIDLILKSGIKLVVSKNGVIKKGLELEGIKCLMFQNKLFKKDPFLYKGKINYPIQGTSFNSNYDYDIKKLKTIIDYLKAERKK